MADRYSNESLFPDNPPQKKSPSAAAAQPANRYSTDALFPSLPVPRSAGGEGKPFGELRAPDPVSWSEYLRDKARDAFIGMGAQPHVARHLADATTGIAGVTPMGSTLSAADLTYDLPRGNVGHSAMDVIGALPLVGGARRLVQGAPQMRAAFTPPPWARVESPGEVAAINAGGRSWVTPSTGELSGRGIPGDPLTGVAQRGYEAIRTAPIAFHPQAGPHVASLMESHIESPAGGAFNQASAPGVYHTIDRNLEAWQAHGGPVTASDMETLRQQLRRLPGTADAPGQGVAGRRAADQLEQFMASPPSGAVAFGTPQAQAELSTNIRNASGNYRAGETAETVERAIDRSGTKAGSRNSGMNVGNLTRANMENLGGLNIKTGRPGLEYASPDELAAVTAASQPGRLENKQREWGNYLGGGGGLGRLQASGWAAGLGSGAGHLLGLDPILTGVAALGTSNAAISGGRMMTRAANETAVRNAEDAAALIRRNSPEFRTRAALEPEVADPRSMMRDAMTYALMPQAAQQGKDVWDQQFVPYENQQETP